ncbi:DUF808 domain-containing protein [Granulosicoccaceae sp. 1_MG-2023]|nr:DUF808 domain-containing protein [Granulosicoccaceae sp. 1_MG-2023]
MAGASLLALLDDITTVLDDVAILSKVAAKKTAGVLGDDLALNAQQLTGIRAEREIPVVWAVAKGSFKNKLILVPLALIISAIAPWLITPALMLGGAFLCYEGFEKIWHLIAHRKEQAQPEKEELTRALMDPATDMVAFEKQKIGGAIRTDFILSAEVIVIALGTVAEAEFVTRLAVVAAVAALITVGVYGLVAGIVKMDDAGLYLSQREGEGGLAALWRSFGRFLLRAAPVLMKTLSIVGTAAMFMVGGGILLHGIPGAADWEHHISDAAAQLAAVGPLLGALMPTLIGALVGVVAGAILMPLVNGVLKLFGKSH